MNQKLYIIIWKRIRKKGIIFKDTDSALRENEELFKEYFASVVPAADNKFAALNSAVWSGGSFIYVPKNVKLDTHYKHTSVLTQRTWVNSNVH